MLNEFALSRVYYTASILPLAKTTGKEFEQLMEKFIWSSSGKVLRVSLEELKLPFKRGGFVSIKCHDPFYTHF